ncbi:MAG: magnesium transporter [Caldisericaceae bacterium]|nr:magnesium transporter [Caldisericaceae bacterium]
MKQLDIDNILEDIEVLIEKRNTGALQNIIIDLHPADIAQILSHIKKDERSYLFSILPPKIASDVLSELDPPIVEDLTEELGVEKISKIVDQMDSDDAADFVSSIPEEMVPEILDRIPEEDSNEIKELLHYEEDTAGGIMALEYVALPMDATVKQAIHEIRRLKAEQEITDIYSIYVVDDENRLLGVVSLSDLALAEDFTQLKEIMKTDIPKITPDMDQEEVANIFSKYDLVSMPVVDQENHLIGRITIDDVVDVLEEEGSEDMAYIAGAPDEEITEDSIFKLARARLPWLLVAFMGELLAAFILNQFDVTLQQKLMIASFIPIIMAMGGSTAQQASVIVIRGLATGDLSLRDTGPRLLKEFRISLLNSLFFAIVLFLIVYLWDSAYFATILAVSIFVVINNAAIIGALVPLTFKRLKIDPALAAAPFISTTNDILGILIYLTISTLLLSHGI